ncbi:hypothetical protein HMPREF1433_00864, partial [Helicobacter pylori GAMchJs117Ai]
AQLVFILAQLAITFSVICIDSFSQSKIARITNAFYLPLFLVGKDFKFL